MSAVVLIAAAAAAFFAVYSFKLLPAKWLCDYGEAVSEKHLPENRRLPIVFSFLFAVLNAGAALLFIRSSGNLLVSLSFCACGAVLLLIAICDYKYCIIPNELLALCLVLGLPLAFRSGWRAPLYGLLIGGGLLFCILFIAGKLLKAEAMGMGDILLSGLCGILCGGAGYAAVFLTAVLSAGVYFTFLLITKRADRKSSQPFGPFLALGFFSALCLYGEWSALFWWYIGY